MPYPTVTPYDFPPQIACSQRYRLVPNDFGLCYLLLIDAFIGLSSQITGLIMWFFFQARWFSNFSSFIS